MTQSSPHDDDDKPAHGRGRATADHAPGEPSSGCPLCPSRPRHRRCICEWDGDEPAGRVLDCPEHMDPSDPPTDGDDDPDIWKCEDGHDHHVSSVCRGHCLPRATGDAACPIRWGPHSCALPPLHPPGACVCACEALTVVVPPGRDYGIIDLDATAPTSEPTS